MVTDHNVLKRRVWSAEVNGLSPAQTAVLAALREMSASGYVAPSYNELAQHTGYSVTAVSQSIAVLEACGYVDADRTTMDGRLRPRSVRLKNSR